MALPHEREEPSSTNLKLKSQLPEALFDAFSGLTLIFWTFISGLTCVAKLHKPLRHLASGLE
jgi:hypothetical protein